MSPIPTKSMRLFEKAQKRIFDERVKEAATLFTLKT